MVRLQFLQDFGRCVGYCNTNEPNDSDDSKRPGQMNTKTTTYLTTVLILAGFLLIVLGWNGAASTRFVDAQLPYVVSGGMAGVGLVVAGCTLAIIQELRKTAATIAQAVERSSTAGRGDADDPMQDTLPEPRTGSTIEREPADA